MFQPIALVFLGGLIVLFLAGCQLGGLLGRGQSSSEPTTTSDLSSLKVTVHEFDDRRPDEEIFTAEVRFTNSSSRIFQRRKFGELSCLLQDGQGNVIGYKNCSTGGLLPKEHVELELDIKTLSEAPAQRFVVLDGNSWETLAVFDVDAGTAVSQSNIDADAIYASETYRGQAFASPSAWTQKLTEWEEQRPGLPDPLNAANGALVASRLSSLLDEGGQVRNDKWKHCVIGAEIAASAGIATAKYAGWYREYEDLTDGDSSTSFNEIDYEATVDGANQADLLKARASLGSDDNSSGSGGEGFACPGCIQACDQRWGDRSREWNGEFPPM